MKSVAFYTLGCKLNQSESEALASAFQSRGFSVIAPNEEADLYVLNSCTVTSMAEQKARRMIRKFAQQENHPAVVVTGCYAQLDPDEIEKIGDNVIVSGMNGKSRLIDLPDYFCSHQFAQTSTLDQIRDFFSLPMLTADIDRFRFNIAHCSYHSRAFIKIQDGCDNRCNYCRIPLARGNSQSLSLAKVKEQVQTLLEGGYKEVVLTGINISAWKDLVEGQELELADLIIAVADLCLPFQARVRLSSLEPDRLTNKLLKAVTHPAVTPHLHLPLQSMSQTVIERMNRFYQVSDVIDWINEYRSLVKNPFMAADLITGFDGESDEEFEETYQIMEKLQFAHLHVFPFSKREGTVSYKPKHPVAERVRDERAARLRELSDACSHQYWKLNEGKEVDFLIEGIVERQEKVFVYGITENYLQGIVTMSAEAYAQRQSSENPLVRCQIVPAKIKKEGHLEF